MFDLEHHQKILIILNSLNSDFFRDIGAYFGGGTQLALQYGEYRWSKDIDFICPIGPGYRTLRKAVGDHGYDALFSNSDGLEFPRDIKADQYGVRFAAVIDETPIKFEIVAEARVELGDPQELDWCPVPCLSFEDACTEKLLSNADRWADVAIESRDLIDLAILRLQGEISVQAYEKANDAYDVEAALGRSIRKFQEHPKYRDRCFSALQVSERSNVIDGLDLLASDHGYPLTARTDDEE